VGVATEAMPFVLHSGLERQIPLRPSLTAPAFTYLRLSLRECRQRHPQTLV